MFAGTGEGYFREEIRGTGSAAPRRRHLRDARRRPLAGSGSRRRPPATSTGSTISSSASATAARLRGDAHRRLALARSRRHWTRLLATNVRGGCLDLAIRPDRPRRRAVRLVRIVRTGDGLSHSRARAANARIEVVLREPGMGRTSLAIAPSNPDVIYALAASNDPGPDGDYRQGLLAVYRSTAAATPARGRRASPTPIPSGSTRCCSPTSPARRSGTAASTRMRRTTTPTWAGT